MKIVKSTLSMAVDEELSDMGIDEMAEGMFMFIFLGYGQSKSAVTEGNECRLPQSCLRTHLDMF